MYHREENYKDYLEKLNSLNIWGKFYGNTLSIIIIVTGNRIGDPSLNPGWNWLFYFVLMLLGKT